MAKSQVQNISDYICSDLSVVMVKLVNCLYSSKDETTAEYEFYITCIEDLLKAYRRVLIAEKAYMDSKEERS